jgi:hypothetical protein
MESYGGGRSGCDYPQPDEPTTSLAGDGADAASRQQAPVQAFGSQLAPVEAAVGVSRKSCKQRSVPHVFERLPWNRARDRLHSRLSHKPTASSRSHTHTASRSPTGL